MVRAAAETLDESPACSVVRADLSRTPFCSAFDLIFSTATFHWIQDHERLFAELHGALRARGRLEAQCGGGPNLAALHARADALAIEPEFSSHFAGWQEPWNLATPDETEYRLRKAGFRAARCWLEHAPTTFGNAERYRDFIQTVVLRPYLAKLSEHALRTRYLEALVAAAADDDPPYTLDYWRLNISATTM
jgi:trans-aconitate 2-methyltransferase